MCHQVKKNILAQAQCEKALNVTWFTLASPSSVTTPLSTPLSCNIWSPPSLLHTRQDNHLRGIGSLPPDRLGREKRSGRPLWTFFELQQLSRTVLGHSQLCRFLGSLIYIQVTNVVWSQTAATGERGSKSVQNCASCFNFPHDQPPNWLPLPSAGIVIPRYSGIITWAFWWCGATR